MARNRTITRTTALHDGKRSFDLRERLSVPSGASDIVTVVGIPGFLDTRKIWELIRSTTGKRLLGQGRGLRWLDYDNDYITSRFTTKMAQGRIRSALDYAYAQDGPVVGAAHSMGFGHAVRVLDERDTDQLSRTGLVGFAPANVCPRDPSTLSAFVVGGVLLPDLFRVAPVAAREPLVADATASIGINAMVAALRWGRRGPIAAGRDILGRDEMEAALAVYPRLGGLAVLAGRYDEISPGAEVLERFELLGMGDVCEVYETDHVGFMARPAFADPVASAIIRLSETVLPKKVA